MPPPLRVCAVNENAVTMRRACEADAFTISQLREAVWKTTYRGIYPDEKLDHYPFQQYINRDSEQLRSSDHIWYLFFSGDMPIGYFSFGPYNYGNYKDFELCLNHLYILKPYHGIGLGKWAFDVIINHCRKHNIHQFFCGCNANNLPAMRFYSHLGGIIGDAPRLDVPKEDQIIHFEFYLGD